MVVIPKNLLVACSYEFLCALCISNIPGISYILTYGHDVVLVLQICDSCVLSNVFREQQ